MDDVPLTATPRMEAGFGSFPGRFAGPFACATGAMESEVSNASTKPLASREWRKWPGIRLTIVRIHSPFHWQGAYALLARKSKHGAEAAINNALPLPHLC